MEPDRDAALRVAVCPKAILDALQHGGAYYDDSQIVSLSIIKREVVPDGKTLVSIQPAEGIDP